MAISVEALLQDVQIPTPEEPVSTQPSLSPARICVAWMFDSVQRLNQTAGFESATSILIRDLVLASSSQAAILWRHGLSEQARSAFVHSWILQSLVFEPGWEDLSALRNRLVREWFAPSAFRLQPSELDREFLLVFLVAVSEKLMPDEAESQARHAIRLLSARLEFSNQDLGQWLGVSAGTVEQWESGGTGIPVEVRARLSRAISALNRMLAIFRPERLPQVVRQEVEIFNGQSARDWILQDRIQAVADLYEAKFAYQG